jgi:hypothetical protein
VGLGYHDKWVVNLEALGAIPPFKKGWTYEGTHPQPQNLRVAAQRDGREGILKSVPSQDIQWLWERAEGEPKEGAFRRLKMTFLLPPVESRDALLLKTELYPQHNYRIKPAPNSSQYDTLPGKNQPFSLAVRKASETLPATSVSRYCPLQIDKAVVKRFGPYGPFTCPVEVEVSVRCLDEELIKNGASIRVESPRVVDDSGQEFYAHSRGVSRSGTEGEVTALFDVGLDTRDWYGPPLGQRKGRLWLESAASVNDGWPKKIKVLLKEAPQAKAKSSS